eukprot:TRINITY_DN40368_c0_g1_i1.p1 TRINITY_DN40368_c0_g1~~TRINITY_DN40368_c0_g1_i1.p1  ORF type:complete len:911 (-),score=110.67 TRINITY_DN40368_c0_g1_i1:418-3150(-)
MASTVIMPSCWAIHTPKMGDATPSGSTASVMPEQHVSGNVVTSITKPTTHMHSRLNQETLTEQNMREILDFLEAEDSHKVLSEPFTFFYKKRKCQGSALHAAVLCQSGLPIVEKLLSLRANVEEECTYTSFDKDASAMPIHLAVQSGSVEIMRALVNAGASLDARSRRENWPHFCPLHEAAFFQQLALAQFLLEENASVNTQNLEGMTPLHVAAKIGCVEVADILMRHGADSDMKDFSDRTALKVAVESGVFPHRRLHLLAKWSLRDIMIVADHCPSAAAEFMKDINCSHGQVAQSPQIVELLEQHEALTAEHWIHLMTVAPEAGVHFLEILTVEPDEDSVYYHPLPTQACVSTLRCEYRADKTWMCDTEVGVDGSQRWPEWHERIAPRSSQSKRRRRRSVLNELGSSIIDVDTSPDLVPVHIRQLRLPGMINARVLHALSDTTHLDVFKTEATQTVLKFTWDNFVGRCYMAQFVHRLLELAVLISWTFFPPLSSEWDPADTEWRRRWSCSFIWVSAFRETLSECWQAYGYIAVLNDPESYWSNPWNYLDLTSILLFDIFATNALFYGTNLESNLPIFAFVVLARWIQMLYSLRGFSLGSIGIRGIIPILQSMKEIGGMLIICLFTFAGFAHAFLVLDNGSTLKWNTLIMTARLLFLVDGDGIDAILNLGGRGGEDGTGDAVTAIMLGIVVFMFCISLLNLFIAVHGEAYSSARREAMGLHLQERAAICLQCLMQPQWPPLWLQQRWRINEKKSPRWQLGPIGMFTVLAAVFLPTWAGLLAVRSIHPIFPSVLLLGGDMLGLCFLTKRPWASEGIRAKSFLWWCAPVQPHGNGWWPQDDQRDLEYVADRLTYLEHNLELLMSAVANSSTSNGQTTLLEDVTTTSNKPRRRAPMTSPQSRRLARRRSRSDK